MSATPRSDLGVKLAGTAVYGTDLDVPGMLWAALVPAPGTAALGIAPDGVASVTVHFRGRHPAFRARVRANLWSLPVPAAGRTACGLDWSAPGRVVLRTVSRCTPDTS